MIENMFDDFKVYWEKKNESNMLSMKQMIKEQLEIQQVYMENRLMRAQLSNRKKPLPLFDGRNYDVNDWGDMIEETAKVNGWSMPDLMTALPCSLSGLAEKAFQCVKEEFKQTSKKFIIAMVNQLDPLSFERNQRKLMEAKKDLNEPILAYVERLEKLARRTGESMCREENESLIKRKVIDCVSEKDRGQLSNMVSEESPLITIAINVEKLLETKEKQNHIANAYNGVRKNPPTVFKGQCWGCKEWGHTARLCSVRNNYLRQMASDPNTNQQNMQMG